MMFLSHINHGEVIFSSITATKALRAWTHYLMKFMESSYMQNAKVLSQKEVKAIIAEHFDVPENKVVTSRYSYMIITDDDSQNEKEDK